MLPDYPKTKAKLQHRLNLLLRQHQNRPPFGDIGKTVQHEGDRATFQSVDGKIREMKYREFSHTFEIEKAAMPRFGLLDAISKVRETGTEMEKHMTQALIAGIDAASKEADTGVTVGDKELTPEAVFECLERMHIDFGIDGKQPPELVLMIHPNMTEQVKRVNQEIEASPELQRRHAELIERKRREYYDRESRRRLVD